MCVCLYIYCMSMPHVPAACPFCMSMAHVPVVFCPCRMDLLHVHNVGLCSRVGAQLLKMLRRKSKTQFVN